MPSPKQRLWHSLSNVALDAQRNELNTLKLVLRQKKEQSATSPLPTTSFPTDMPQSVENTAAMHQRVENTAGMPQMAQPMPAYGLNPMQWYV